MADKNKENENIQDPEQRTIDKKDTPSVQTEKNLEQVIIKQEKTLRQKLDAMEKVTIEIPEDPNNPDDVVPVGWNGIIYAIPRGQQFEVPEVIYNIWKESYDKTKAVNKRIRESTQKEIQIIG